MSIKVFDPNIHRCRKCNGNVAMKQDIYGDYLACLMCGTTNNELLKETGQAGSNTQKTECGQKAAA